MTRRAAAQATHAYFLAEGTAYTLPSSGTVSSAAIPDSNDTSWASNKLATIKDFEMDPGNAQLLEVMAPAPGVLQRSEIVQVGSKPVWSFTFSQVDALAYQLFLQTLPLTNSSTQANPQERQDTVRGALKVQIYDDKNNLNIVIDCWGVFTPKGTLKIDPTQLTEWQAEFRPLFATFNSIKIS